MTAQEIELRKELQEFCKKHNINQLVAMFEINGLKTGICHFGIGRCIPEYAAVAQVLHDEMKKIQVIRKN